LEDGADWGCVAGNHGKHGGGFGVEICGMPGYHRAVETKAEKDIISAFLELCREKGSLKVSVKEICRRAGVSRVSFYAHFEDLDQLLDSLQGKVIADMNEIFKDWSYIDVNLISKDMPFPMFGELLSYTDKNRDTLRALFMDSDFFPTGEEQCRKMYLEKLRELTDPDTAEILAAFIAGGIFTTTRMWVNDAIQAGPEDIARALTELVSAIFNARI
jgi:AcrR family transcriptional regulator